MMMLDDMSSKGLALSRAQKNMIIEEVAEHPTRCVECYIAML